MITETEKQEETAAREHNELQTRLLSSRAEKEVIQADREGALTSANATNTEDMQTPGEHQEALSRVLGELLALQSACFPKPMTAVEARVKREEELAALKQAFCILDQHGTSSVDSC